MSIIISNKIKVAIFLLALICGQDIYKNWQKQRVATQLEETRSSVDLEASTTGMILVSAWRGCVQIGIVNNMEGCAAYQGRLLQEMVAPKIAKAAIEKRSSYYEIFNRFYSQEYCGKLLERAIQLSLKQLE